MTGSPITKAPETKMNLPISVDNDADGWPYILDSYGQYVARCATKREAEAIVTACNSYDSLARELEQAKAVLERVLPLYQSFVDDSGGCDHSVGICMCEDFAVLSDIRAALKVKPSNEVGT